MTRAVDEENQKAIHPARSEHREPPVSICVPTYNRLQVLRRALISVANQSYSGELRCIVSENGQTDGVEDLLAEMLSTAPDIHWSLSQGKEFVSPVTNWKRAITAASTEWIKVLWDDDWLEPEFVEKTVRAAISLGVSAVTTGARVVSPKGDCRLLYTDTPALVRPTVGVVLRSYTGLLPALPVSPAAALLKRDSALAAIEDCRAMERCFEQAMGPDLAMILSSALGRDGLAHVPEVLVNFWAGHDSITMTSDELQLRLCYDRVILDQAARHGVPIPLDVRRRLQHRSFLAWARREPDRGGLLTPRPSLPRLARNVWDRRAKLWNRG